MEGDIQFVADSFLLERTFQILAEAELGDGPLRKYAFDLGSLLETIKSGIQSFVKQNIDTSSPGTTVLNLLAPAVFFRLHPVLGILMTAAQLFGLDLGTIYQKIVSYISPMIQSGNQITAGQVNDAARAALPSISDDSEEPIGATANLLDPLYDLYKHGELEIIFKKEAIKRYNSNQSALVRMFSFLGKRKGSNLLVGILSWFIKTILMSAGMLAVGGMAASALGLHPTGTTGRAEQTGQDQTGIATVPGVKIPTPTGAGSWNFKPKPHDLWVENLNGAQPYQRVVDWATESYPDLSQYQDIIVRTPSFWNVVRGLTGEWRPGQSQWVIPDPYKTRNEILALFIPDVYRTIQQQP